LLSKEASANSLGNLNVSDREFSIDELYFKDFRVRPSDYEIF